MTTKRCFKCLEVKALDDFYAHSRMADGRLNKCKLCTKADVTRHRLENLERIRAYDKLRGSQAHRVAARKEYLKTPEGRAARERARRASRARFPNRAAARNAVSNAIRDGRLVRQPCLMCGSQAEAHHPDYDRPLDVVWLCQSHHKQAHALVSNDSQFQEAA